MRTAEVVFLAAVLFFAACFAGLSLSETGRALSRLTTEEVGIGGAAGTPRDVEIETIRRMIREGALSDREADFYKTAEPGVIPGPVEEGR